MLTVVEKKQRILEFETRFAKRLALKVIERPTLSIWMILIPVIFVYFFYRFNRFNIGQKKFAEDYMIGIRRALNEAEAVVGTGKPPDPPALAHMSDVPDAVRKRQTDVYAVLVEHYVDLLRAEGNSVESWIQAAYRTRTHYLLFVNRLGRAEKDRNAALIPILRETTEGVDEVVERIERFAEELRREIAEQVFPST